MPPNIFSGIKCEIKITFQTLNCVLIQCYEQYPFDVSLLIKALKFQYLKNVSQGRYTVVIDKDGTFS